MNAIIYSRVSTHDQDNARQIEELKEYAAYKKLTVLKVFEEKITGTSKAAERREFKLLLEYVGKHNVDCILVWELSRLGRSMMDVLNTIEMLSEKKINLYIKKEGMNTLDDKGKKSTMTTMLISILSGFAEMERETIRQRSISGIRQNVATGGSGTGLIKAYGYEAIGKKLYVNAEEAKIIRLIFAKYLSGLGTGSIASYLNSKNIPTRFAKIYGEKEIHSKSGFEKKGKEYKWVDGTVYSILKNSIYKGDRKHRGEVFQIEPIIDAQTFDRVQVRRRENVNMNSSKLKYFNPLKDILKCGHPECELHHYSYFMHKRANNKDNAYKCISKRYKHSCGNPSIGIDKLQKALFWVCQPLIVNDALDETIKKDTAINELLDNKRIEIQNTNKQILQTNSKLDSLLKMNLNGEIDPKRFTTINSEFLAKLGSHNDRLMVLSEELERLINLQKAKPASGGYSRDIFNKYVKDAIEYIKVHPVSNTSVFEEYFTFANDVPVIIEVKSLLAFRDGHPATTFFVLSRYSGNLIFLEFPSASKDPVEQIRDGQYAPDFVMSLDIIDYNKPFQAKHSFITQRLKHSRV